MAPQGAGQQQRTLPRQQMQASHLSYHGQSLQAPYRQSSPSLGVLAAAEPPLPQARPRHNAAQAIHPFADQPAELRCSGVLDEFALSPRPGQV